MSDAPRMESNLLASREGFGASFAPINVQRLAGKIGVSPSPPRTVRARYK
jgi:hypothetical protein